MRKTTAAPPAPPVLAVNRQRFNLSLSGDLAAEIQRIAIREHRTVTAQIEHLLERALDQLKAAA